MSGCDGCIVRLGVVLECSIPSRSCPFTAILKALPEASEGQIRIATEALQHGATNMRLVTEEYLDDLLEQVNGRKWKTGFWSCGKR